MRKKIVIGNWKMNGGRASNAQLLDCLLRASKDSDAVDIAVCPPTPYLSGIAQHLFGSRVTLGAQDLNEYSSGAYTGEVSGSMLVEVGCQWVLVGHSERRTLFGETDDRVARKFEAALKAGLTPVLCIGETLEERRQNRTYQVVTSQLQAVIACVGIKGLKGAVIAYEPVWAIGTGETATPAQAQEIHEVIRNYLHGIQPSAAQEQRIVYGGSVKAENAMALFSQPDIDGGLIGGASLDADAFLSICASAGAA
ncbi:triose-phosphate isomerase [Pseudomonas gingeri]|uniref:triose-phosphate isomerase n=1 Tax=Pseudomonas gingeri TaxID=117681 RepID=UPI0015A0AA62|nr:triose-phosphate isomerase [Pseudomonas gingeri]NWA28177.1 triose-phosphate isomerase [Pseudomonas gingeri]NWD66612.1 triose-phosphate isomerase [Pseudomonas gingeri]